MKKLSVLLVLCLGCAHIQPTKTSVPITEEGLYYLNLSVNKGCMDNHPDSQFWQNLCFCTSQIVINNVRTLQIGTMEELSRRRHDVIPNKVAMDSCIQEALFSSFTSLDN